MHRVTWTLPAQVQRIRRECGRGCGRGCQGSPTDCQTSKHTLQLCPGWRRPGRWAEGPAGGPAGVARGVKEARAVGEEPRATGPCRALAQTGARAACGRVAADGAAGRWRPHRTAAAAGTRLG